MPDGNRHFDLTLAYPQWQGSGRHDHLPRGAQATAEVCARFAPRVDVPPSDDLSGAHGVNRWGALIEQFASAQALLARHAPARVLTAGGDCAVDIAVIDYLHARHPDLTVIWVDAHLDANTPETSPSGNFHGMPVSALMGRAPAPMQRLLGAPLAPDRFFYFGARVGDEGDWAFQRDHGLAMLDVARCAGGPVHIHFDLDVLDPGAFPYLAYPEAGGPSIDDVVSLVRRIATANDLVGLTITEFAPADDADARKGSEVIARLCEAATQH